MTKISAFLWAYRNWQAGAHSIKSLKRFYPDADIIIQVDKDGDIENYHHTANELDCLIQHNSVQIGYCGNFGSVNVGREQWPRELAFAWMDNLHRACSSTNSEYMMVLEEDDFVLSPISILNDKFSMAIHPTDPSPIGRHRPNRIPPEFIEYSREHGGVTSCPGYGAGGGVIFNRLQYMLAWDSARGHLYENYDRLSSIDKIIGWEDFLLQYIMMLGGYPIVQNHRLCEHWEVPHLWTEFEIVTGLKDYTQVKL